MPLNKFHLSHEDIGAKLENELKIERSADALNLYGVDLREQSMGKLVLSFADADTSALKVFIEEFLETIPSLENMSAEDIGGMIN